MPRGGGAPSLIGLVIAAAGLGAHQLTGSAVPDAIGSILVGLLLAAVAIYLIDRNRELLIGEEADPRIRAAVIRALLKEPEVARVRYLRLEIVGPRIVAVTGVYRALWLQPVATGRKWSSSEERENKANPLPPVATGCRKELMVRRGLRFESGRSASAARRRLRSVIRIERDAR